MWIIPLEAIISHSTIALLSTYRISLCQEKKEWELSFDPSPFGTQIDIEMASPPQLLKPREKKHVEKNHGKLHCCLPGHQPGMAPGWLWFSCAWSSHYHYLLVAFMLLCPFLFLSNEGFCGLCGVTNLCLEVLLFLSARQPLSLWRMPLTTQVCWLEFACCEQGSLGVSCLSQKVTKKLYKCQHLFLVITAAYISSPIPQPPPIILPSWEKS